MVMRSPPWVVPGNRGASASTLTVGQQGGIRAVQVLQQVGQHGEGNLARRHCDTVRDERQRVVDTVDELRHQPTLPDPGLAGDQNQPDLALPGSGRRGRERTQLGLPADHHPAADACHPGIFSCHPNAQE